MFFSTSWVFILTLRTSSKIFNLLPTRLSCSYFLRKNEWKKMKHILVVLPLKISFVVIDVITISIVCNKICQNIYNLKSGELLSCRGRALALVSGLILNVSNMKSCLYGWKFMDSQKTHKAFVLMAKQIERTSGHKEYCSTPLIQGGHTSDPHMHLL